MFPLKRYALPENWDKVSGRFLRGHPQWKEENEVLRSYEQRAADAVRSFELDHAVFTFDKFEEKVFGAGGGKSITVAAYIRSLATEMEQAGHYGNSVFYNQCARAVEQYKPNASLSDIDSAWLSSFEKNMRKRGALNGGVSVNLRTLRASCKKAAKSGVISKTWQPFDDFSLSHLKGIKIKKALTLDDVRRIESVELPRELEFARDLFMLSFYFRGMNLTDLAELTGKNIKASRLVYVRKKTGKAYSLPINDKATVLLSMYARPGEAYLLTIFTTGVHVTDRQKHYRINKMAKQVNTGIRAVADLLCIDTENLTFYSARHSYATALERKGVSRVIISQALGHESLETTAIYLKEFGDMDIDAADELLK